MIELKDIKAGDEVVLEHEDGTRCAPTVVLPSDVLHDGPWVNPSHVSSVIGWTLQRLPARWSITDHKPLVVLPPLPTEPGLFIEPGDQAPFMTLYELDGGKWSTDSSNSWRVVDDDKVPAGLIRLVPTGSERQATLLEVVAWLRAEGYSATAEIIVDRFEVEE